MCAVDFKKANDSIEFDATWKSLQECEVEESYIELLSNLYEGQKGIVSIKVQSDEFPIKRGTNQGDPVSIALFNAVFESCMRRAKSRWRSCSRTGPSGFLIKSAEDLKSEKELLKKQWLPNQATIC